MPRRNWSFRLSILSALLISMFALTAKAQPPSPLELARGLRDNEQFDLALEYLKDLDKSKQLSPEDKAAILLERAKCLLQASEVEPEDAVRVGMTAEAKRGLKTFLDKNPSHPRRLEALLIDARLTATEGREQLNRALRMELPTKGGAVEAEMQKQKATAKKARDSFVAAAKLFSNASEQINTRLSDKSLDTYVRRTIQREAFEAELASAINHFNTAETFIPKSARTVEDVKERNKHLEKAKATFDKLGSGQATNRSAWIARAWVAEVLFEQDKHNESAAEFKKILQAPGSEAEDGKRLASFFQLRRNFLDVASAAAESGDTKKLKDTADEIGAWLNRYGNSPKPPPEVYSARYYRARLVHTLADIAFSKAKGTLNNEASTNYALAERTYRSLTQSNNEYKSRAERNRMLVVRRLMGDADQPLSTYDTFEKAQMASLIQLNKLVEAEEMPETTDELRAKKEAEIKSRLQKIVAILDRCRQLATAKDDPADVADIQLRLIYFYQASDQPYQAAVLGERVARTIKNTGGKASYAAWLSLSNYLAASKLAKDAEARVADRERAMAIAKFLDEKFPNDNATDIARHHLATLYQVEDRDLEAFEILLKVRPVYPQIINVRLLEGYLAAQLVTPRESTLPPPKKAEIFRRATIDLNTVVKPKPEAEEEEVRLYISARTRLALLYLAQSRADPTAEETKPGYDHALTVIDALITDIPKFQSFSEVKGKTSTLNLNGREMMLLAQEAQGRAVYLRARALIDAADDLPNAGEKQKKYDEAAKTMQPILDAVEKSGALLTPEMKKWFDKGGEGQDFAQKARVAEMAGNADKRRVDVILTAFRLKVKQAKAQETEALLNLMTKAGGSVQDSLPLLEPVGRELAAQMAILRKEGKKAEADALGAGLATLLTKITTVPKLPQPTTLFVGQMLLEVGEFDKATETLKKIPPPEFPDWQNKKQEEVPAELRGRLRDQTRDYAMAQLGLARALREGKKFKEAEDLLHGIVGTNDKPGWGSGRLYFRKELAMLYEDKGASIATVKEANLEWGKALQEWTTLFRIQNSRLSKMPKETTPQQATEYRNAWADAFFDANRCLVKANQQLLKAQPPAKLQKTYDDVAKKFADMEKQIPVAEWQPEVQHRYVNFLKEVPQMVEPYKVAGGKFFLEKMPVKP